MSGKNQHVVPSHNGWGVRSERSSRLTVEHRTQEQAIFTAREIARNQHSELLIHNRHGQIRERNSYGKDPYPPKG
jgi:hypothetical protein